MSESYIVQRNPFMVPTDDGKSIKEHFGIATDGNTNISIAHMIAPPGWSEPPQTPEFDEFTLVIRGKKQFLIEGEKVVLGAGESIKIMKNTRVQYANPFEEACEYVSVCTPAFDINKVHREEAT